eukprot:3022913-Rhodomonas_salina.1
MEYRPPDCGSTWVRIWHDWGTDLAGGMTGAASCELGRRGRAGGAGSEEAQSVPGRGRGGGLRGPAAAACHGGAVAGAVTETAGADAA